MNNTVVEALSKWLSETFNDFYTIWDGQTCDQRFVQHPPESDNGNFVKLLEQIYKDWDFSTAVGMVKNLKERMPGAPERANEFIITSPQGAFATIFITPYDEEVYHTDLVKDAVVNGGEKNE